MLLMRCLMLLLQLAAQVVMFLTAGYETSTNSLSFLSYYLSTHLEAQEKLHQEIDGVLGERAPAVDDLPKVNCSALILSFFGMCRALKPFQHCVASTRRWYEQWVCGSSNAHGRAGNIVQGEQAVDNIIPVLDQQDGVQTLMPSRIVVHGASLYWCIIHMVMPSLLVRRQHAIAQVQQLSHIPADQSMTQKIRRVHEDLICRLAMKGPPHCVGLLNHRGAQQTGIRTPCTHMQ
jgi:hypothetical protein